MVNNMVFRWPKPLFCPGFGGSWNIDGVDDFSGPASKGQNPTIFPMSTQIYRGKSGISKTIRGSYGKAKSQPFWWSHVRRPKGP